jgi:hypothetical protein
MAQKMLSLSQLLSARSLSPPRDPRGRNIGGGDGGDGRDGRDREGRESREGRDGRDVSDSRERDGRERSGAGGVGAQDPYTAYTYEPDPDLYDIETPRAADTADTPQTAAQDRYLGEVRAAYAYSSLPFMVSSSK